jgi:hypothetical protein
MCISASQTVTVPTPEHHHESSYQVPVVIDECFSSPLHLSAIKYISHYTKQKMCTEPWREPLESSQLKDHIEIRCQSIHNVKLLNSQRSIPS